MEQTKFEAILTLLVPQIISIICEHETSHELDVTKEFYKSNVYATLEREETKLWHLSARALYEMYAEEKKTGTITFPEEA